MTITLGAPRIGSGMVSTGFRTTSELSPVACWVLDPSNPHIGGASPSAREQFINLEIIPDGSASTTVVANDGSTANTSNQGGGSSTLTEATNLTGLIRPDAGGAWGTTTGGFVSSF